MIICLFGGVRVRAGMEERARRLSARIEQTARVAEGFVSFADYASGSGDSVGIIRFASRGALDRWAYADAHLAVQEIAGEVYESFWIQTAETYRDYTWVAGVHTDRDLTDLFAVPQAADDRPT